MMMVIIWLMMVPFMNNHIYVYICVYIYICIHVYIYISVYMCLSPAIPPPPHGHGPVCTLSDIVDILLAYK